MSRTHHKILEFDIYLPRHRADGRTIPKAKFAALKKRLVEKFGGLTETTHKSKGHWKIGAMHIREAVMIWRVVSEDFRDGDRFMRALKLELERELEQDEILIIRRLASRV